MIKKIILYLIIVFVFIFNIHKSVFAQGIDQLTVPGYNCGQANVSGQESCCRVYYPSLFIPTTPDMGILNVVVWPVQALIGGLVDITIGPIISIYEEYAKKNIQACYSGVPSTTDSNDPQCKCINPINIDESQYLRAFEALCQRQTNVGERIDCLNCANRGGVYSGIGCLSTNFKQFIEETIFKLGIGLAGGLSLLCIIYAAFMMQSSQGNPEKLKKAQELITSCIMGLMLIIFSIFILKLIGVDILRIPGFS